MKPNSVVKQVNIRSEWVTAGGRRRTRAAVFADPREGIRISDVDIAAPAVGEVAVQIVAAGVCHSDLHVVRGEWALPGRSVLGHEGAGIVTAVGPGVTTHEVGDHVVLSWMADCGTCRYCSAGRPAQCARWNAVVGPRGTLFDGTSRLSVDGEPVHHYLGVSSFAELAVVPASGAIKIRTDAPLDRVALVGCAVATGVGAVFNTARVAAGATVAVIGCGGVGLSVVQGARIAGAGRIIAVDLLDEKLRLAERFGASETLDASQGATVARLRSLVPEGLDFVFDAIGTISTIEQAISALGLGGAAVIVGLPPAGELASFNPLALATNDQRILGSNYGSIDPHRDIPRYVDWYMEGRLDLDSMISARLPLSAAAAALDDLASGVALRQLLIPNQIGDC